MSETQKEMTIILHYGDGDTRCFEHCVIDDALAPELSFVGTMPDGPRVHIVTTLPYTIVTAAPTVPKPALTEGIGQLSEEVRS